MDNAEMSGKIPQLFPKNTRWSPEIFAMRAVPSMTD
jgi:hypothetical protein